MLLAFSEAIRSFSDALSIIYGHGTEATVLLDGINGFDGFLSF